MRIVEGHLDDPAVQGLLNAHVTRAMAETGRGSAHALDAAALKSEGIRFWSIWDEERVLSIGALKQLSRGHGEIKSMYTSEDARGRGTASLLLRHLVESARRMGIARLSLETGAWDYFAPARAFYRRHGFKDCAPFGDYKDDPNSAFLTLVLPPEIEIRSYAEHDLEAVIEIWLEGWRSTGVPVLMTRDEMRERWRQQLVKECIVHVAVLEREVVGDAALEPRKLEHLFVAPEHQCKGIGKQLLDFVKAETPEGFSLETAFHTRAPAFYEREGLVQGETGLHPRFGHETVIYYWRP